MSLNKPEYEASVGPNPTLRILRCIQMSENNSPETQAEPTGLGEVPTSRCSDVIKLFFLYHLNSWSCNFIFVIYLTMLPIIVAARSKA
jgi:hypothetical protein